MATTENADSLGYAVDLQQSIHEFLALTQQLTVATATVETQQELHKYRYWIMMTYGFCQLYGISVNTKMMQQLQSILSTDFVFDVIATTIDVLTTATIKAQALPEKLDADELNSVQNCCTELLHILMETWAVFLPINDKYQQHLNDDKNKDPQFRARIQQLLSAFDALDDVIQQKEQIRLLSTVSELPLLNNWRKMLIKSPIIIEFPWWLGIPAENALADISA